MAHLADYLPPQSWFLLIEPGELESEGRQYLERLARPQDMHTVADVIRQATAYPSVTAAAIATGSLETTCRLPIESVERFSGHIDKVRDELDDAGRGQEVFLICQTEAEIRRLGEVFGSTHVAREGRLHFSIGTLQSGFRLVPDRTVVLSSGELFRRADVQRPAVGRRHLGRAIDSFLELHEGDLVVHLSHGIARYRGMKLLEKNGQAEEHLVLEFHAKTKLYVPASKIDLVQKYVGGAKSRPDARPARRTGCGTNKRSASRRPSSIWPATCSNCKPCGRRGRASAFAPTPNGSTSSTPRSPSRKRPIN